MENSPLFFGIQQWKRLFVRFAEKIGKDDQPNSRKANGQPGGGIALAVQQAAQEQVANAGKGTADDGDEGIHPPPMGGRNAPGHIGLFPQGLEDLADGEDDHQQKIQRHLQLHIAIAVQSQHDQGLTDEELFHIPDFSEEGGHQRRGQNDHQGVDAGQQAENLCALGPVQGFHIQRQQIVELGVYKAAKAPHQRIEHHAFPLPQNADQADLLPVLLVLTYVGLFHAEPLDEDDDQQGGGEGCTGGDEERQPQVVLKKQSAQGRGQHQAQIHAQVLQAVGLFPAVAVAQVRNQSVIGGALDGCKHTGDVVQSNADIGQRDEPRKDAAPNGNKVAGDDDMLPVPAVCQFAAEKQHGELENTHDHGDQGNGGGIVAQLVFQDQGQQRPDERAHAGDDPPPEEDVNLPVQIPVLPDKFLKMVHMGYAPFQNMGTV